MWAEYQITLHWPWPDHWPWSWSWSWWSKMKTTPPDRGRFRVWWHRCCWVGDDDRQIVIKTCAGFQTGGSIIMDKPVFYIFPVCFVFPESCSLLTFHVCLLLTLNCETFPVKVCFLVFSGFTSARMSHLCSFHTVFTSESYHVSS